MELTLTDIKLNQQQEVASSKSFQFLDPRDVSPPKGVNLHLLTKYGCTIRGKWKDSGFYTGWAAMPSIPQHMKYSL